MNFNIVMTMTFNKASFLFQVAIITLHDGGFPGTDTVMDSVFNRTMGV